MILDQAARLVTVADQRVDLTRREVALLEVLMTRPMPEGVDAVDPGSGSSVYWPIVVGPALLSTLDRQNRHRFLREVKASMERD